MRLPPEKIETHEQLAEFDQWLTAKLEKIKDSEKFTSDQRLSLFVTVCSI